MKELEQEVTIFTLEECLQHLYSIYLSGRVLWVSLIKRGVYSFINKKCILISNVSFSWLCFGAAVESVYFLKINFAEKECYDKMSSGM